MKKGFTLLEILVVIGIIAVLVAVASTSYSTAQKKARDAKRKGDLKSIQNAMEQYYSVCGFTYPSAVNPPTSINCATTGATLMSAVPTDPSSGSAYSYTISSSAFTITATLESAGVGATFAVASQQ